MIASTHRATAPDAPHLGGAHVLAEMPYRATYVPLRDPTPREPWLTELQQMGIDVIAGRLKLKSFARERAGYYEALIISRPHNMHRAAGILRLRFPKALLIYCAFRSS